MRSALLSKKLKLSEIRLLVVDDNQVRYNKIVEIFEQQSHQVNALLLDDINNFEKQLATQWDLIIFGRAYDLKLEQAFPIIQNSMQPNIPVLMLRSDDYHPDQYSQYLNKGVFDILNLDFSASTYAMLVRALVFSRLVQTEKRLNTELETMQQQAQSFALESNKAIAVLEEGVHIEANEEYVRLFGFQSDDELLGLPIMDVLQPKNIQQFKQNFKKISNGQFDQTGLEISSSNPDALHKDLKLEYFPAENGTIQLIIDVVEGKGVALGSEKIHPLSSAMISIMRHVNNNPANFNTLVVMSLKKFPEFILDATWEEKQMYFTHIVKYLQDYSDCAIHKLDPLTYLTLVQAESQAVLDAQLMGLKALQKPQLLTVQDQTLQLSLRLGYQAITQMQYDDQEFLQLISQAYNTVLPEANQQENDDFLSLMDDLKLEPTPVVEPTPDPTPTPALSLDELTLADDVEEVVTVTPVVNKDVEFDLVLDFEEEQKQATPTIAENHADTAGERFAFGLDLNNNYAVSDLSVEQATISAEPALSIEPALSLNIEPISPSGLALDIEPMDSVVPVTQAPSLSLDIEPIAPVQPTPTPAPSIDFAPQDTIVAMPEVVSQPATTVAPTPVEVAPVVATPEPAPASIPTTTQNVELSPMLKNLQQSLQSNLVALRFQQYYDKDDTSMFTYEVSSAFIYENAWKELLDMPELKDAPELSIELDRWMVIEASKQLHNFVTQYPNSRIVVNLNQHILTNPQFPELVGKLAKMIGGKQARPLVLQFSEQALSENVGLSQHYVAELHRNGVDIAIRGFGTLLLSDTILKRIPVDMIGLHTDFNKMIHDTNGSMSLQEKINGFREIRPEASFVLHQLDDMNSFANAWNVDARFIQSAYFQKRMDHLVMQTQ